MLGMLSKLVERHRFERLSAMVEMRKMQSFVVLLVDDAIFEIMMATPAQKKLLSSGSEPAIVTPRRLSMMKCCFDGINSLCIAKEWFVSGLLALVLLCLGRWMRSVPLGCNIAC